MGYYVKLKKSNVELELNKQDEILKRWKELNDEKNNHLKTGGSYSNGKKDKHWFSWMPSDYDKTVNSCEEVLDLLGFEYEKKKNGNIKIVSYDNKSGAEQVFFNEIADLIKEEQYMHWKGEDNSKFIWIFGNGKLNEMSLKDFKITMAAKKLNEDLTVKEPSLKDKLINKL